MPKYQHLITLVHAVPGWFWQKPNSCLQTVSPQVKTYTSQGAITIMQANSQKVISMLSPCFGDGFILWKKPHVPAGLKARQKLQKLFSILESYNPRMFGLTGTSKSNSSYPSSTMVVWYQYSHRVAFRGNKNSEELWDRKVLESIVSSL